MYLKKYTALLLLVLLACTPSTFYPSEVKKTKEQQAQALILGTAERSFVPTPAFIELQEELNPIGLALFKALRVKDKYWYPQENPHMTLLYSIEDKNQDCINKTILQHLNEISPITKNVMKYEIRLGENARFVLLKNFITIEFTKLPQWNIAQVLDQTLQARCHMNVEHMAKFPEWRPHITLGNINNKVFEKNKEKVQEVVENVLATLNKKYYGRVLGILYLDKIALTTKIDHVTKTVTEFEFFAGKNEWRMKEIRKGLTPKSTIPEVETKVTVETGSLSATHDEIEEQLYDFDAEIRIGKIGKAYKAITQALKLVKMLPLDDFGKKTSSGKTLLTLIEDMEKEKYPADDFVGKYPDVQMKWHEFKKLIRSKSAEKGLAPKPEISVEEKKEEKKESVETGIWSKTHIDIACHLVVFNQLIRDNDPSALREINSVITRAQTLTSKDLDAKLPHKWRCIETAWVGKTLLEIIQIMITNDFDLWVLQLNNDLVSQKWEEFKKLIYSKSSKTAQTKFNEFLKQKDLPKPC